jgi:hypothetical protein
MGGLCIEREGALNFGVPIATQIRTLRHPQVIQNRTDLGYYP